MTEREKIKEMARAICGNSYNPKTGICDKSDIKCDFSCVAYLKSKRMYALGYGNVKEAVKEFAELVKIAFHYEFNDLIPAPILSKKIDELIKEVCGE